MRKLELLIDELYERRHQQELDTVMPVIGDEGMGKSTLLMQLAVKYCMVRDGEPPTIEHLLERVCYDRADFKQAMAESDKQALIIVPDAARILYSMDVAKSEQKTIEKDLMDVRGLEYMILLGFQSWKGEIKERRSKLALKIPRRGLVRVYGREAMDQRIDEGSWPQSTMTDKFQPLDGTELWDEYQRVDEQQKRDRLAGEGNEDVDDAKKQLQRKVVIRGVAHQGMTLREASKLVDYSESWVQNTLADWRDGDYQDLVDRPEMITA